MLLSASSALAQAPGLAWTNATGGKIFAVDAQNNVYASSNGIVLMLNSAGVPQQTSAICPLPGVAQRDASGNFYLFGSFDGLQNFGGITLMGGWTNYNFDNANHYEPGYPTLFLAKYAANGSLQWAVGFGHQSFKNHADDLVLNPDGSLSLAFDDGQNSFLALFTSEGSNVWQVSPTPLQVNYSSGIKITPFNGTNGAFVEYNGLSGSINGGFFDPSGNVAVVTGGGTGTVIWQSLLATNGEPFPGTNDDIYVVGLTLPNPTKLPELTKWKSYILESSNLIGTVEQWLLAGDARYNLYMAGVDGSVSKYTGDGALVWSGNYGSPVVSMLIDATGNRFISRSDGSIAKLQPDTVTLPSITNAPLGGEIFVGSNFTFTVGAMGYAPLSYYWCYQSNGVASPTFIPNATNATLSLVNATKAQSGLYSVIVSNLAGSVTSTPVTLVVKAVELFDADQMLTNGTYHFANPPTLSIHSAFPSGQTYYTLDGSTPSFLSTPYSGPFLLSRNATVNAIGYSADFAQSELADTVIAIVPPQLTLTATTLGGGTITLNPPGGIYASNTVVTATANPATGYSFLDWQGAASGTGPSVQIVMNQNQSLTAIFGTALSTTVQGNGQVALSPPGGLYPYGSVVRLEALPQAGNFFGAWGNAASGNTNPLYFTVTNPTPAISSLFAALGANQSSLTLRVVGDGRVSANPAGNVFSTSQSVTVTATPDAGQTFIGWGGDASGNQNPLTVNMSQSRTIVAQFSGQAVALSNAGSGMTSQGFHFRVMGDPPAVYQIFTSTNLTTWQSAGFVTNSSGMTIFTDPTATNASSKYYRAMLVQ